MLLAVVTGQQIDYCQIVLNLGQRMKQSYCEIPPIYKALAAHVLEPLSGYLSLATELNTNNQLNGSLLILGQLTLNSILLSMY